MWRRARDGDEGRLLLTGETDDSSSARESPAGSGRRSKLRPNGAGEVTGLSAPLLGSSTHSGTRLAWARSQLGLGEYQPFRSPGVWAEDAAAVDAAAAERPTLRHCDRPERRPQIQVQTRTSRRSKVPDDRPDDRLRSQQAQMAPDVPCGVAVRCSRVGG